MYCANSIYQGTIINYHMRFSEFLIPKDDCLYKSVITFVYNVPRYIFIAIAIKKKSPSALTLGGCRIETCVGRVEKSSISV